MSTKGDVNSKKTKKGRAKNKKSTEYDVLESLINEPIMNNKKGKKVVAKKPVYKNIVIDMENDSKDEIIEKLVLTVEQLKEAINELKIHVEGTYCTTAEHYRFKDDAEKELTQLESRIEELE